MINFEIPQQLQAQQELLKMVAEQAMRPYSRDLDENEHKRAKAFVDMTWPFTQQEMAKAVRKAEKALAAEAVPAGADSPVKTAGSASTDKPRVNMQILSMIMMVEMLSWGDTGQYLGLPHPMLGGSAIDAAATPEQKIRFYKRFTEGAPKWGGMAITEPNAGSDNSSMRTTAVFDETTNEWVLNGEKIFITNGSLALVESDGFVVVWATVDPSAGRAGIKSFVVEAGTPGVSIAKQEEKLGIRASDTVSLAFVDARIPADNILGNPEVKVKGKGFKKAMKTFDASRPAVAASAIGIARAAVEMTEEMLKAEGIEIDYKKPYHELTAVERDFMEMEARYKSAWLLTLKATSQMMHGESNRLEASQCKYRAGEAVTWITQKAVELLGPVGYTREHLLEKWMRDAKINDIYEGTKQINQLIVARALLGYGRKELA